MIIGKELHQDGEPHLHLVVAFRETFRVNSAGFWDFVCNKHGDYRTVGRKAADKRRTINYVLKEGDTLVHGLTPEQLEELRKEPAKRGIAQLYADIKDGHRGLDLIERNPAQALQLKRIKELVALVESTAASEAVLAHFFSAVVYDLGHPMATGLQQPPPGATQLINWLNDNLGGSRFPDRPIRAKQLWLVGTPGCGKSTFIGKLMGMLNTYVIAKENFQDEWRNGEFDLAIVDEFRGELPMSWLNSWLDGTRVALRRKGIAPILKTQNIPTIICSNFKPHEVYENAKPVVLEALEGRLEVVEVAEMDIFPLLLWDRDIRLGDEPQDGVESQAMDTQDNPLPPTQVIEIMPELE